MIIIGKADIHKIKRGRVGKETAAEGMIRVLKQSPEGYGILALLLDETLCGGTVYVDAGLARRAGGLNERLKAKQTYELVLRIAEDIPVEFTEMEEEISDETKTMILLPEDTEEAKCLYGWQTDYYVAGRYSSLLRENGLFDEVIMQLIAEAEVSEHREEMLLFLTQMIGKEETFWRIEEAICPVLIYKGDDICHNVLTVFAEQFGQALERTGKRVLYFDVSQRDVAELTEYMNQRYQAIIGVQTWLFSVKMKDGIHYLHEYLYGPKFNFIFDHPIWMMQHLLHRQNDFYVLTHDDNYVEFVRHYFRTEAFVFPPAGMERAYNGARMYDLSFVGTYGDYRQEALIIHQTGREKRFLANRFLLKMRKNPNMTAEAALALVLKDCGREITDDEFLELLWDMRRVIYCVMHYFRDRALRKILEAGIRIDVFGNSWQSCPLRKFPNLICHEDVSVEESLSVFAQSKLSLNIMSWHKSGFTERMANIMLAGAVLVTDTTTCLTGQYEDDDMIVFNLERLEEIPEKIKAVLQNEELRRKIAENGRKKTRELHTWDRRAEEFTELLQMRELG